MQIIMETDASGQPVRTPNTGRIRAHAILEKADHDAGMALYFPGPLIDGFVELPTGASYDVSPLAILVKREHVKPLHAAIHAEHHRRGRFLDIPIPKG